MSGCGSLATPLSRSSQGRFFVFIRNRLRAAFNKSPLPNAGLERLPLYKGQCFVSESLKRSALSGLLLCKPLRTPTILGIGLRAA